MKIPTVEELKEARSEVVSKNKADYDKAITHVVGKITEANTQGKRTTQIDMSGVGFGGSMVHFAIEAIQDTKGYKVAVAKDQVGCNIYKIKW